MDIVPSWKQSVPLTSQGRQGRKPGRHRIELCNRLRAESWFRNLPDMRPWAVHFNKMGRVTTSP